MLLSASFPFFPFFLNGRHLRFLPLHRFFYSTIQYSLAARVPWRRLTTPPACAGARPHMSSRAVRAESCGLVHGACQSCLPSAACRRCNSTQQLPPPYQPRWAPAAFKYCQKVLLAGQTLVRGGHQIFLDERRSQGTCRPSTTQGSHECAPPTTRDTTPLKVHAAASRYKGGHLPRPSGFIHHAKGKLNWRPGY